MQNTQFTASKVCFKCYKRKPYAEFYKHKAMGDGHLNKCKECAKRDVAEHRLKNIEKIREYDRARGSRMPEGYILDYSRKYPNTRKAHLRLKRAVDSGVILKLPCEVCGSVNSVAHHDDYLLPLEVRWLCQAHHKQWHAANGPGKNRS